MYERLIKPPKNKSFFLFGPRGTGKTTWIKANYKKALIINLLESKYYLRLLANPDDLAKIIPQNFTDWIVIDEVQRVPELLNIVHHLIESKRFKFILTGSSARKLKQNKTNLLAGRALPYRMYPLTALELKKDFKLEDSIKWGHLPALSSEEDKEKYLYSYIETYLREEVQQEGLVRNLSGFSRFLQAASFSQGAVLNFSSIAHDCFLKRYEVRDYFTILEDLLIGNFLPSFTKKAKRDLITKEKFYYFDVGVFKAIRPKGPLEAPSEVGGIGLETLIFQELTAINEYFNLGYRLYFWRTKQGGEVDFILYGEKGLIALEVKSKKNISRRDLKGLRLFLKDYPIAKAYLLYNGETKQYFDNITVLPIKEFLTDILEYL
jgi:predicted AAA+ superfamily ATPase